MSSIQPRQLKVLVVDDKFGNRKDDEILRQMPIEVKPLTHWTDFCRDLHLGKIPNFEVLLIDFNFEDDDSSPPFPKAGKVPEEFKTDSHMKGLAWSPLVDAKTSGILIGATFTSLANYRDIPVGASVYTGFPGLVMQDMATAMLVVQILCSCQYQLRTDHFAKLLKDTIVEVETGPTSHIQALPSAVKKFRHGFLRRALPNYEGSDNIPVLMLDLANLSQLQDLFSRADTPEALDEGLAKVGLKCWDRNGSFHCLDIRSLFLDLLMTFKPEATGKQGNTFQSVRPFLPLETVKPGGVIAEFIDNLFTELDLTPIIDYLNEHAERGFKVMDWFKNDPFRRFLAFLFAWCSEYCDRVILTRRSYDPLAKDPTDDPSCELAPLSSLLLELRVLLLPYEGKWLPLSSRKDTSIMKLINTSFQIDSDSALAKSLGYHEETVSSDRRQTGVKRLLRNFNLITEDKSTQRFRFDDGSIKTHPIFSREHVLRRLGYRQGRKNHNIISRIIESYLGDHINADDFYNQLNTVALAPIFRECCSQFIEQTFPDLNMEDWPLCVQDQG